MPSHSMPTDNGKYDHLLTITLEGRTVTIQENDGWDGKGATIFRKVHEFASEAEAEEFYQAQCRRDPYYSPPTDEEITLQRGEPVYLEFSDECSHKFYEVTVSGVEIIVRYGRIGSRGQITSFVDRTTESALATGVQKIKDKLKRGYVRSQTSVSSSLTSSSSTQPAEESSSENLPSDGMQSSSPAENIANSAAQVLSATLQTGEEVFWQTAPLQLHSVLQIVAISHSSSFSFNLMAGEDFAYHFNPRSAEAQIVQNTGTRQHWGTEERLPLPQEMAFGRQFELTIAVQETELALYLNDTFLCHYRHRISPTQIDGLRLICGQGSLQILSVKISDNIPEPVAAPEIQASSLEPTEEEVESPDLDISQFVRSTWQPIVTEGDSGLLASKFAGRPWLAQHESWLNCPCCNQPMQLFVQLNLNELPEPVRQEYGDGLLQMFHCVDANCDEKKDYTTATVFYGRVPSLTKNVLIRLVKPTGEGAMPPLPMMNGESYETYFPAKTITGWLEIEDYPDIDDLMALVNGWDSVQDGSDGWDELVEQLGFADLEDYECHCPSPVEGDKLAGYPYWVQGMEYPGCPICQAPMRQVFQLGSDNNLPYVFGDMGTAHVLQCKTHKDQFAFVWSCG